ncbi:vitelline membrane outer layer protein 1-like, partial [Neopelma chrysocephalum]|uniref:vitelline membrane outer layer protein 1-like n=1 Tax=Neopelma chrysocephalum TaxID=114329 RepID=UPI000FCCF446
YGTWGPVVSCPPGEFLVSFKLKVEESRGIWDDTAANDLTMRCLEGASKKSWTLSYRGSWGGWSRPCLPTMGICGLRTRVEGPGDSSDSTGLNDVQFFCCDPPETQTVLPPLPD